MGARTKIEWTDRTFNPWIGCRKVSPGCVNCYAEESTPARVLRHRGQETWGAGAKRSRTSAENWKEPLRWNVLGAGSFQQVEMNGGAVLRGTIEEIAQLQLATAEIKACGPVRPRVFCASLADWLDDEVPIEWLVDLLVLIYTTPNLDWQLLTKRPENLRPRMQAVFDCIPTCGITLAEAGARTLAEAFLTTGGTIMHNIWFGVTCEDQTRAEERIPMLLKIPAKVRFLSCEPLLGAVQLNDLVYGTLDQPGGEWHVDCLDRDGGAEDDPDFEGARIDWVICGGESGPGARPMHPDWARSLRYQCAAYGVPFFFKQWGEWGCVSEGGVGGAMRDDDCVMGDALMRRVGKKAAGRLLDGVEWNGFPLGEPMWPTGNNTDAAQGVPTNGGEV